MTGSLAGRVAYLDLDGFDLGEVGPSHWRGLWLRGGFPLAADFRRKTTP